MAQRRARTADRDRAVETINEAYVDGQLTGDERDARVASALGARTLVQLGRVTTDLQAPKPPPATPPTPAPPPGFREQLRRNSEKQREEWRRVPRWQKVTIGALATLCIGGLGASIAFGERPDDRASSATKAQAGVSLTAKGMSGFVSSYESKFGTTRVVSATLATDNVVIDVPTSDGKARHEEWRYRDDEFTLVADARANAEGQGPIELDDIDLARLEDNIADAKRTLGVESPTSVLVWVEREYREQRPSVRIQVSNTFQETAMLITDLDGQEVFDRTPFSAPKAP